MSVAKIGSKKEYIVSLAMYIKSRVKHSREEIIEFFKMSGMFKHRISLPMQISNLSKTSAVSIITFIRCFYEEIERSIEMQNAILSVMTQNCSCQEKHLDHGVCINGICEYGNCGNSRADFKIPHPWRSAYAIVSRCESIIKISKSEYIDSYDDEDDDDSHFNAFKCPEIYRHLSENMFPSPEDIATLPKTMTKLKRLMNECAKSVIFDAVPPEASKIYTLAHDIQNSEFRSERGYPYYGTLHNFTKHIVKKYDKTSLIYTSYKKMLDDHF